jgi:hypothetical protein
MLISDRIDFKSKAKSILQRDGCFEGIQGKSELEFLKGYRATSDGITKNFPLSEWKISNGLFQFLTG